MGTNTFSYATFTVPVDTKPYPGGYGIHFIHPVKIINPKNNKSVTIKMMLDTGAQSTYIKKKDVDPLGLDIKDGVEGIVSNIRGDFKTHTHNLLFQIGNLKPILLPVRVGENLNNLLGRNGLLDKLRLEITGKKLSYIELAQAAMGSAQAYFRSRF